MASPPSYEESASDYGLPSSTRKGQNKDLQHISIREEVGASRSQHVAAVVSKLVERVRERAKSGLAQSTLLVLLADQEHVEGGKLVGSLGDKMPVLIQLAGRQDGLEFWRQQEVLDLLKDQMLAAVLDGVSERSGDPPLPPRQLPQPKSLINRRTSKTAEVKSSTQSGQLLPVSVDVLLDEAYFQSENAFGLFETRGVHAVVVTVMV
ncbi:hypothetical protein LTR08_008852 [Meristemomyces frigidus]|nr:hypothetical protein LTR08_008852 [Meristemomyces frigidus]